MARYGQAFKDSVVAKLLPPQSASLQQVWLQTGVSESTLERGLSDALAKPAQVTQWTPAARFNALLTTAAMDEHSKKRMVSQPWDLSAGAGAVAAQCRARLRRSGI